MPWKNFSARERNRPSNEEGGVVEKAKSNGEGGAPKQR